MFTATSSSGRTVSLLNDADRECMETNATWYCPFCKECLQLKTGKKRRAHFAHRPNTACPSSNPESERHLEGKALLFQWLKAQGADVHVEVFCLKAINVPIFSLKTGTKGLPLNTNVRPLPANTSGGVRHCFIPSAFKFFG